MIPGSPAQAGKRPWLALFAAACLLLAVPAGRFAAARFTPDGDLLGYGGLAIGLAGIGIVLLAGALLGLLSLLRRESPRVLSVAILLASGISLVCLFLQLPG